MADLLTERQKIMATPITLELIKRSLTKGLGEGFEDLGEMRDGIDQYVYLHHGKTGDILSLRTEEEHYILDWGTCSDEIVKEVSKRVEQYRALYWACQSLTQMIDELDNPYVSATLLAAASLIAQKQEDT